MTGEELRRNLRLSWGDGRAFGIRELDSVLLSMRDAFPPHIDVSLVCATCMPPERVLDVTTRIILGAYGTVRDCLDALDESPTVVRCRDDDGEPTGMYRLVWAHPGGRMILHVYAEDLIANGLEL